jgi:hypothetical protein
MEPAALFWEERSIGAFAIAQLKAKSQAFEKDLIWRQ